MAEIPIFGDERLPPRFWSKVVVNGASGCWEWTAYLTFGYGHLWMGGAAGRNVRAHRLSYERLVGPIPADLEIDHQCRVRNCVNPLHLEAVTRSLNVRRGVAAEGSRRRSATITRCPSGHAYVGDNLYVTSGGSRSCNECRRNRQREERPTPRGAHNALKTHCPHGHEYSPDNVYLTSQGGRACATCKRAHNAARVA